MVFDSTGSYILDKSSGEKIAMKWHKHTPVFEVEVMQPLDQDRKSIETMGEPQQQASDGPPVTPGARSSTDPASFHRPALSKL